MEYINGGLIGIGFLFFSLVGFLFGLSMWVRDRTKHPLNKLTFEEAVRYEQDGYLVISPRGDTQDFVFGPAESNFSCGDAYFGMTLDAHKHIDKYKGKMFTSFLGGVVGLEDCKRLRDHLDKHIVAILRQGGYGTSEQEPQSKELESILPPSPKPNSLN